MRWTNSGRLGDGMEVWRDLVSAAESASIWTMSVNDSDELAFTWPRTQEGLDQRYPDKEALVTNSEQAEERIMGMLREGQ